MKERYHKKKTYHKKKKKESIETEKIPSKEDMRGHGMFEEDRAIEHFCGKSLEEASELFFINSELYADDFLWMSVKGYFYYIKSIKKYLLSEKEEEDHLFVFYIISDLWHRLNSGDKDFNDAFENHKKDILDLLLIMRSIIEKDIDYNYSTVPIKYLNYDAKTRKHFATLIQLCEN